MSRTLLLAVIILSMPIHGFAVKNSEDDQFHAFNEKYKEALKPGRYCPTQNGKTTWSANTPGPVPNHCIGLTFDASSQFQVVFGSGRRHGPFTSVEDIEASTGGGHVAVFAFAKCQLPIVVDRRRGVVDGDCETPVVLDGQRLPFKFIQGLMFSPDGGHVAYVGSDECLAYNRDRGDVGVCSDLGKSHLIVEGKEIAQFEGIDNLAYSDDGNRFAYTLGEKCSQAKSAMGSEGSKLCQRQMNRIDGQDTVWYELVTRVSFSSDGKHWAYYARRQCFERAAWGPWLCKQANHELATDRGTVGLEDALLVAGPKIEFTPDSKYVVLIPIPWDQRPEKKRKFLLDFSAVPLSFERHYGGQIGTTIPLHATIRRNGNELSGFISYDKHSGRVQLKGNVDVDGNFTLFELDEFGKQISLFKGDFHHEPALGGEWSRLDGSKFKTFLLSPDAH